MRTRSVDRIRASLSWSSTTRRQQVIYTQKRLFPCHSHQVVDRTKSCWQEESEKVKNCCLHHAHTGKVSAGFLSSHGTPSNEPYQMSNNTRRMMSAACPHTIKLQPNLTISIFDDYNQATRFSSYSTHCSSLPQVSDPSTLMTKKHLERRPFQTPDRMDLHQPRLLTLKH